VFTSVVEFVRHDGLRDRLRTTLGSKAPTAVFIKLNKRPAELVFVGAVLEAGGDWKLLSTGTSTFAYTTRYQSYNLPSTVKCQTLQILSNSATLQLSFISVTCRLLQLLCCITAVMLNSGTQQFTTLVLTIHKAQHSSDNSP